MTAPIQRGSLLGGRERARTELLYAQNGRCAICKTDLFEERRPSLDHCHATGFVRGVLCNSCNIKLGWYETRRREIETYLATAAAFAARQVA